MNISDKVSSIINNGISRPSKFKVRIFGPSGLGLPGSQIGETIKYTAEKIEIPSLGVSNIDYVLDQSLNIQVPFRRVPQGTINITFQLDENHSIRKYIESWFSYLVQGRPNSPTYFVSEYYEKSTGTIIVSQLSSAEEKETSIMSFQYAYPSQSQPFSYDWGERDSYLPYTVTFNYYDMISR
jgi:hypothetical protein